MKRIIGIGVGKPKIPPPDLNTCVANMDKKVEDLEKKSNQCETELIKMRAQMKKMGEGTAKNAVKQKLVRTLQRKKAFETQIDNLRQQSFNMEQVSSAVQSTKDTKVVVNAMKAGVSQLKKELKKTDIDKIEDLQDDLEDILEQSDEVQEALGRSYNVPEIDEDELNAELDALGDDIALDDDSSYLDHATLAPNLALVPNAPDRDIGRPDSAKSSNGITLDEFGLPQVSPTLKTT